MDPVVDAVCRGLDELASSVKNAWADDRTLNEAFGWNCLPLNRHDLAAMASRLAQRLRTVSVQIEDEVLIAAMKQVPQRIQAFSSATLPYIYNGNANLAAPVYTGLLEWIEGLFLPYLGWEINQDPKAMPSQVARRLRSIRAEVEQISVDKGDLAAQISLIQQATQAAESLPVDLQELKAARDKIDRLATESAELFGKIDSKKSEVVESADQIKEKSEEASKLVAQCEEAYRITTTKGLAAAFDLRATQLSRSMWVWVVGLLAALIVGAVVGRDRIMLLSGALSGPEPQWSVIWLHIALSFLSVAAPLWFAWIATKQIGQRFRLAEDYAFKASVAKAYEGYRREAARIDETFEARLFSSALSRLEEAPLRLVEEASHGSPWHELVASPAFQNALAMVPELRDKFLELAKEGLSTRKSKQPDSELSPVAKAPEERVAANS